MPAEPISTRAAAPPAAGRPEPAAGGSPAEAADPAGRPEPAAGVTPTAAELRAAFDEVSPFTVGLEEETMLLDPGSLDLAPVAATVIGRAPGDARFKPELPAAQLELVTAPASGAVAAVAQLAAARRDLLGAAAGIARPAAAGVHPFAAAEGVLSEGARYERIEHGYGGVARRQLVASLQVHVAVGGADRTIAVYNALRSHLPELAALAANAPFHDGRDSGLASVRPTICTMLPRQGVPPAIESWEAFAEELRWGAAAGGMESARMWWWELRPHVAYGTLELRVPDAQTRLVDGAGIVALAHALVVTLAERHDAGELPPAAVPSWRIAENRWSAIRHGLDGTLADLETGAAAPTRDRLHALIDAVEPTARRLGSTPLLAHARALVERNGAQRQRAVAEAAGGDLRAVAAWLADAFADDADALAEVAEAG